VPAIARDNLRTMSLAASGGPGANAWQARDFLRPVIPLFAAAALVASAAAVVSKSAPPVTEQPVLVEPDPQVPNVASKGARLQTIAVAVAVAPQDFEAVAVGTPALTAAEPPTFKGKSTYGVASYYWQGTKTASGERFDSHDLTAAHRTLPFGTRVRVTSLETGRSVTVRINDRGPYVDGRIVDISRGAAQSLGMIDRGVTKVKLDVLQ
jgi:rare lipoprotein A